MVLVTGAMVNVILKLGKLLQKQYKLQKGVRKRILSLSCDLESMYAALRKVAEVPPEQLDEQVKLWARDVRELSYNVEDILDTFFVRIEGHEEGKKKWYKRAANEIIGVFSKTKARYDISSMMKIINEQAEEVAKRHQRYRADNIVAKPAPKNTVDPRLKLMYKEVDQLVGIDKSSSELISMLSSPDDMSNKKLKIVSVVGFGGLGKTTLVKALYDKLISEYDCGAFVSVGQKPILADVFKKILFVLSKQDYQNIHQIESIDLLIGELRNFLRNKRYLIVIDDIWEIESWEIIDSAFVEDNNGSRIITTSRKLEVSHGEVYNLQPLSEDNSKKLFYTRIFGGKDKCLVDHQDEVSNAILKKCGGVPLAIITMASLLMGKSKEEWIEVRDSPGFYRNKDDRHVNNTSHILALSYYDLPCHLKSCLLYLSVYPEDYIIDKDSLIWKWIAEGFVEKKPGIGLFEVGEEYFHDLINRSMIQEVDLEMNRYLVRYNPLRTRCRVHDMVLDLILSKSLEESFASDQGTLSETGARRLAQKNRALDLTPQDNNVHAELPQVRSFIACVCDIDKWTGRHPKFGLLRVLALERCTFWNDFHGLEHLGKLIHLRYLGIRHTHGIYKLPEEIGKLKFLQILDLLGNDGIEQLPSSLGMLTQMVCLLAGGIMAPDGIIGKLTLLEELQIHPPVNDELKRKFVKDLGNLHGLRVLSTGTAEMDESMLADFLQSLGSLHEIQHLTIDDFHSDGANKNYKAWDAAAVVLPRHLRHLLLPGTDFSMLPSCINPLCLPSLSHLDIFVHTMDDHALKTLGGLPELRYLRLGIRSKAALILTNNVAADGYFHKLRSLELILCTALFVLNEASSVSFTLWTKDDDVAFDTRKKDDRIVAPDVMPSLQELQFNVHVKRLMQNNGSCGNLGLEYLPSLHKVRVYFEYYEDAFADDVDREEAALRHAIESHPNQPTLQIQSLDRQYMKSRSEGADIATDEEDNEVSCSGDEGSSEQEEDEKEDYATTLEPFQLNSSQP